MWGNSVGRITQGFSDQENVKGPEARWVPIIAKCADDWKGCSLRPPSYSTNFPQTFKHFMADRGRCFQQIQAGGAKGPRLDHPLLPRAKSGKGGVSVK